MASKKPFSDVTATSDPIRVNAALAHAITAYDQRQAARGRGYNVYALAHYCNAVNESMKAWQGGQTLRGALVRNFTGPLLDRVLKAVQEPKSTDAEQRF